MTTLYDIDQQALWQWVAAQFTYAPGHPLMMGSIPFALLFVVFLTVYVLLRRCSRTAMMVWAIAFSIFFAYKSSGSQTVWLMLTAIVNYRLTELMRLSARRSLRRWLLWLTVGLDVGLLAIFKYYNFVVGDVLNQMLSTNFSLSSVALPIGVSFFTFQAISYAVDVYRGTFSQPVSRLEYYFYLTCFPLLMAGPITRARHLIPQLHQARPASARLLWTGLFLFMLGLLKKNVLGDYLAQFNDWVFDSPASFSGFESLMAMMGYPVQLYLDFSGYSDMSIGVMAMMGFALPDNFLFPYRSLSITDFWRRWHVSLSSWFRDYVYIPLGGNRKGTLRLYLNNLLTMLVAGLWHGASWMFVLWGLWHGVGLVVHKCFSRQLRLRLPSTWWGNTLSWVLTYVFLLVGFTLFRASDLATLHTLWQQLLTDFSWAYLLPFWHARAVWCVVLLVAMLSYAVSPRAYTRLLLRFVALPWGGKLLILVVCLQLVVEFSQQSVQPFIYSRF